jgi:hypothetical protein
MKCKYCGEEDESELVTRTEVVDGKVQNVDICTSCLGEELLDDIDEDGSQLPKNKTKSRRTPTGSKPAE